MLSCIFFEGGTEVRLVLGGGAEGVIEGRVGDVHVRAPGGGRGGLGDLRGLRVEVRLVGEERLLEASLVCAVVAAG